MARARIALPSGTVLAQTLFPAWTMLALLAHSKADSNISQVLTLIVRSSSCYRAPHATPQLSTPSTKKRTQTSRMIRRLSVCVFSVWLCGSARSGSAQDRVCGSATGQSGMGRIVSIREGDVKHIVAGHSGMKKCPSN